METGKLIVLEGPDGVGKTTQVQRLSETLQGVGVPVLRSREPGNAFDGQVRALLMNGEPVPLAALFLFLADRAQHMAKVVEPALAAGTWVVLDRFVDSTLAYQWWADIDQPTAIHETFGSFAQFQRVVEAAAGRLPDLVLALDLPMATCQQRLAARAETNAWDLLDYQRRKRIHEYFTLKLPQLREHAVRIDAAGAAGEVAFEVALRVNQRFDFCDKPALRRHAA